MGCARIWIAAAIVATLAPVAQAGETACRGNALGSVACPVAPPRPRPILRANTQAIDRVRHRPDPAKAPVFVPARRTDRLGTTLVDPGTGPVSLCAPDRLGNLRCR